METKLLSSGRIHWPGKWVFILAAVGSAAGLGNLWRFPALAFEHGGGAFLFAIIIANIVIGVPLLITEVGLGQMMQRGAADALGRIKKHFRYVGWSALILSFLGVLAYYMAVVGWGLNYFAAAFNVSWGADPQDFFFNTVLKVSPDVATLGGFSLPVLFGLIIGWAAVYFAAWKSVKSISRVIVWTATLPFVILAILIAHTLTLTGAGAGLAAFFLPQWGALADPELWLAAFSQVFFSLSLAFGIMYAYGSFKARTSDITKSVVWIAGGNLLVSIMAGTVIFGTLGYMAAAQGVPISDVLAGGPSLAFVVFPQAISLLPALAAPFGVLFFLVFFTLAIDSAFSLLEAFATAIRDRFANISSEQTVFALTVIGFLLSVPYATGAGIYLLDIADHFIVNYGLVAIGLLEAVIVGWLWKHGKFREFINEVSAWRIGTWFEYALRYLIPLFLGFLLLFNAYNELKAPYGGYPVWALLLFGLLPLLATPVLAYALDRLTDKTRREHKVLSARAAARK